MSNLSTEQIRSYFLQLLKEEYLSIASGQYVFTGKFYQIIDGVEVPEQLPAVIPKIESQIVVAELAKDWTLAFMKFISDSKVPRMLEGKNDDVYPGNNYSEPAMKVFRKAIEKEGVLYEVLSKSVMLYYKSSVRLKKAIGNYFITGEWRSNYMALLEAAQEGTLLQHIKSETDNGTKSQYGLG